MPPSIVHLPNGQTLTVTPVFGGLFFKANDLNHPHNVFPPGWTIIINSEDEDDEENPSNANMEVSGQTKKHTIHRFRKPTLHNDHLFISSISNPSSQDFKPSSSQTRAIAMMLWASLWWYFHQPAPAPQVTTAAAVKTHEDGRPHGEWRIHINREGIFTGKHLLPKLERMGLIATEDSTVGLDPDDGVNKTGEGWSKMFISRRTFWQLDPRIYLFTLTPVHNSPFPTLSPANSRPASPNRQASSRPEDALPTPLSYPSTALSVAPHLSRRNTPPGPFTSSSHLPTYYPATPTQYVFSNGIRHPIRAKPPRQGETFYTRHIPSLGQYLSFRVASLSHNACLHNGPTMENGPQFRVDIRASTASSNGSAETTQNPEGPLESMTDVELLHRWMNIPRIDHVWGESGPMEHQRKFLERALTSKHSIPVIGSFDGRPFGYFEIYWVREDQLGARLGSCGDYDRGLQVLVGEQEFRGPDRVPVWLSALIHYCWLADMRTQTVMMEPRVDNEKVLKYCQDAGFYKEKHVTFAHKQSNLLKISRDAWEAPAI